MNRIFLNTKEVEKKLYNKNLNNTVIVVNNLRNFRILNISICTDEKTEYIMKKKKIACVNLKNCMDCLLNGVYITGAYKISSIYNRMFKKRKNLNKKKKKNINKKGDRN